MVREAIRLNRNRWWSRLVPFNTELVEAIPDPSATVNPAWLGLIQAFRGLPIEQRAVVALHLYAGYSMEETAEMTGSTYETTRSRLRLARKRLRRDLAETGQ